MLGNFSFGGHFKRDANPVRLGAEEEIGAISDIS